jgi:Protein of unknown function (DUF732)
MTALSKQGVTMTNTAIRRTASAAAAVLLMAVGAAVSVPPAYADPEKNKYFIDYLDRKNVPYPNPVAAVRLAKQFCVDFTRQGHPEWLAGYKLQHQQGWTQTEAERFIEGAVGAYCPEVWE